MRLEMSMPATTMSVLNPPMATPSPRKRSYADADLDILADLEERVHKELQSVQNTPQVWNHTGE